MTAWFDVARALIRRPRLWGTALRQIRVMAPDGWWRRAPFLPVSAADYMRFRLVTQYGDENHRPAPGDVMDYLAWCRRWNRLDERG